MSLGGDRMSYAPSPDHNERQPNWPQPKHPLCTWILERKIPKSMQKKPSQNGGVQRKRGSQRARSTYQRLT